MISCAQYDYIEIVCTYHYHIKIHLKSGLTIQGRAIDTKYNESREECLQLEVNGELILVVLDDIQRLEALDKNPHLNVITF